MRRVVARRGVCGYLNEGLQKTRLLVKVGVNPSVYFFVGGGHGMWCFLDGFEMGQQMHESIDGQLHVVAGTGLQWVVADA
jgi:hypothetical protein